MHSVAPDSIANGSNVLAPHLNDSPGLGSGGTDNRLKDVSAVYRERGTLSGVPSERQRAAGAFSVALDEPGAVTMNELRSLSDEQLRTLLKSCRDVLHSLVVSLNDRSDMQAGIRRLMSPDVMLETFPGESC